jgi:hypothetical protein
MTELPLPDFDGFPLDHYFVPERIIPYLATRGCYWGRCTFCDHGQGYFDQYRGMTAQHVVDQVKALRDKYRAVDPDFKMTDAYVSFMAKSNKLPSMFVEERLKGAAEVADKLHGIANETITMQPGLTSGAVQDSWSDAQMLKWMNEHPHPKTKDERATFARIEGILDQRAAQAQQGY